MRENHSEEQNGSSDAIIYFQEGNTVITFIATNSTAIPQQTVKKKKVFVKLKCITIQFEAHTLIPMVYTYIT